MFRKRSLQALPFLARETASFEIFGFAFAFWMFVAEEVIEHFRFVNLKVPRFREILLLASHAVSQHPLR